MKAMMHNLLNLSAPLVLASASPRRKKLLEQIGIEFTVCVSAFDETSVSVELPPSVYVQTLAESKARSVAAMLEHPALVIGADTTVVLDGTILNKPSSPDDARRMLRMLSSRSHSVYTGIALAEAPAGRFLRDIAHTEVRFRTLSDMEINCYVESGSPLDKAGSYGIQDDFGAVFIQEIHGCYYNVVGLPLELLYRRLQEFSV